MFREVNESESTEARHRSNANTFVNHSLFQKPTPPPQKNCLFSHSIFQTFKHPNRDSQNASRVHNNQTTNTEKAQIPTSHHNGQHTLSTASKRPRGTSQEMRSPRPPIPTTLQGPRRRLPEQGWLQQRLWHLPVHPQFKQRDGREDEE
jgi:hypothetical protein